MDFATPLGLLLSMLLVGGAIALEGSLSAFAYPPALMIVVGGTLTVALTSFSFTDILGTLGTAGHVFAAETPNFSDRARKLLRLAQKARQSSTLSLQSDIQIEQQPFLRQALTMVVDGSTPEVVERVLYHDTVTLIERQDRALTILRRGAEVAPAMGLIGTLIGLVQMLGALSDPAAIGPAMAVAILGTFYGAVLSYVVLTPMATKLERIGADDLLERKLITATALSIAKQENPRQLEMHLNSLLPPIHRVHVFR
jgi:chemotaxis protein MotA